MNDFVLNVIVKIRVQVPPLSSVSYATQENMVCSP